MTREEAIKILKAIRVYECYPKSASEETKEALDMAIEALSAEAVQGEWIEKSDGILFKRTWGVCSVCGNTLDFSGVNAGRGDANYCPNCGAKMKGADNEID